MEEEERRRREIDGMAQYLFNELGCNVQIIASYHEKQSGNTYSFSSGYGDYHARLNVARTFVLREDIRHEIEIKKQEDQ